MTHIFVLLNGVRSRTLPILCMSSVENINLPQFILTPLDSINKYHAPYSLLCYFYFGTSNPKVPISVLSPTIKGSIPLHRRDFPTMILNTQIWGFVPHSKVLSFSLFILFYPNFELPWVFIFQSFNFTIHFGYSFQFSIHFVPFFSDSKD